MANEEPEQKVLEDKEITIQLKARTNKVSNVEDQVKVETEDKKEFLFDADLV